MSSVIKVNPIECDAYGYCAELLPELVALDEWGYPVVGGDPSRRTWSRWPDEPHGSARGAPFSSSKSPIAERLRGRD